MRVAECLSGAVAAGGRCIGGAQDRAGAGGAWGPAGAVSTVAKDLLPKRGGGGGPCGVDTGGVRAARGVRGPTGVPDSNRPPPRADGLPGKLPSPEGTDAPCYRCPAPARVTSLRARTSPR
ncbi:hypothetical protein HEK131_01210 [Streptomyces seoulensis]|nr:hypothetical protein HEK131_01210 [Streptomyces seoulensis]